MWNYYRDEINDAENENNDNDNKINNNKTTSKSFKYKTKIIGNTPHNTSRLNAGVVATVNTSVIFGDFSIYHWLTVKQNLTWDEKNIV